MKHSIRPGREAASPPSEDPQSPRCIGTDIRGLRKAKALTLQELALASGLSVGYLSLIERDLATPSIKALHSIASALGVTISFFFAAQDVPDEERNLVVRRHHRRRLDYSSGVTDELLSPNLAGSLELLACIFAPGASSGDDPYAHEGEEAGVVLRGEIELWVDGRTVLLKAGDSFGFSSALPHRYRNPGSEEAEVIWAITPPSY